MPTPRITHDLILLFGPPAAGKGTLAARLAEHLGVRHISTGEILRAYPDPQLQADLAAGKHADDTMMKHIVLHTLKEDPNIGILDGYPRKLVQLADFNDILSNIGRRLTHVFILDAEEGEVFWQRTKTRAEENRAAGKPVRSEDTDLRAFTHRMGLYRADKPPFVNALRQQSSVYDIDATRSPKAIFHEAVDCLTPQSYTWPRQNRTDHHLATIQPRS